MARLRRQLPARTLEEVVAAFPSYRQSILGTVDNCSLSARFDVEGLPYTNGAQARGIIFHRFAAELLQTLKRTGEVEISTAEALEILYEVSRQHDVPDDEVVILSARERLMLRKCVIGLVWNYKTRKPRQFVNMHRLIEVEMRLRAVVAYDHPEYGRVEREISGQPDAIIADPDPDGDPAKGGAIVLDWKTTPSAPPQGEPASYTEGEAGDAQHVSYEGYWQQRFYAYLLMVNFPSVNFVTLREWYVLPAEVRSATVHRSHLEHIEREITDAVALLDRAVQGGSDSAVWQPSPGKHCAYCRRPRACPLDADTRIKEGGIASHAEAQRVAAEWHLTGVIRPQLADALKSWHEQTGEPIPLKSAKGRYEVRWGKDSGGRRRFGAHVPERSDRAPDPDLAAAFAEAGANDV